MDLARLAILFDATSADTAMKKMDGLTASAAKTSAAAKAVADSAGTMAKGMKDAASASDAVVKANQAVQGSMDQTATLTVRARTELIVLAHEMLQGRFSRVPGSFMVLAENMGRFGGTILAVGGALAGIGGVIAAFATAAAQGAKEQQDMNNAIKTTADYAGVTRQTMLDLADATSHAGSVTIGVAKEIVTALSASGQIGPGALANVAALAAEMTHTLGEDAEQITPKLVKLFADPAKGAEELNKSMHFLTAAEIEHIDHLQRIGQLEQAQAELSEKALAAYPKHIESLGTLGKSWLSVKQFASDAWNAMKGNGQDATTQAKAMAAYAQLQFMQQTKDAGGRTGITDADIERQRQLVLSLNAQAVAEQASAVQAAKGAEAQSNAAKAAKDAASSAQGKLQVLRDEQTFLKGELAAEAVRRADGQAAQLSDQQTLNIRRAIYENTLQQQNINKQMGQQQRDLNDIALESQEKLRITQIEVMQANLEAQHKNKEISDEQFTTWNAAYEVAKNIVQQRTIEERLLDSALLPSDKARLKAALDLLKAQQDLIKAKTPDPSDVDLQASNKLAGENREETDKAKKAYDDAGKSVEDFIKQLKEEVEAQGQSASSVKIANELHKLEKAGYDLSSEAVNAYRQRLQVLYDQQQANQNTVSMWKQGAQWVSDFATAIIQKGANAFDVIRDKAKQFLAELVSIFLQKWVLNLGASMLAGTTAGGALGQAAGAAGQGTIAGAGSNLLGGLLGGANQWAGGLIGSSTLTGGISSAVFGSGALTGAGDFVGTGLAGMAGNVALAAGATDAFAASVAAAVPVIGWVVAIGAILYSVFGKKGGGPKQQGSFTSNFSATGGYTGPGSTEGLFSGDNQHADAAQQLTNAISAGYIQAAQQLGISTQGLGIGVGFSQDPQGDAPSMVHTSVRNAAGDVIFSQNNDNVGRDDASVQTEIQLQASRAVLAALQSTATGVIGAYLSKFNAQTVTQDDVATILKGAAALHTLSSESDSLDAAISDFTSNGVEGLKTALQQVKQNVDDARTAFNNLKDSDDPSAFLAAEQTLKQAIVDRYTTEINLARQLADAIKQLKQDMYQFDVGIMQRIAAAGGSADVAGYSWNYAQGLRGSVGGNANLPGQMTDINNFLGALDTWYQTESASIQSQAQAAQEAAQQQAQAIQEEAQAQLANLQQALQLAQQWKSVLDAVQQQLDTMRLSTANPLSASGRLQLSQQETADMFAKFLAAKGDDKAALAQQLLPSIQTQLGLLQDNYQRPSAEYGAAYNALVSMLTQVQAVAQPEADRAAGIQQQMLVVQQMAAGAMSSVSANTSETNAQMDALNKKYIAQLQWAQTEGDRVYNLQIQQHQEQLNAITGGMDVDLFIAQDTAAMLDELRGLRTDVRDFLTAIGGTPSGSGPGTGTPPPPGTGTNPLARGPGPGSGNTTININVPPGGNGADTMNYIQRNAPTIRRALGLS